jgi:hypothetical protein
VPPSLNFSQLDFVEPSSGFHPVTWERVIYSMVRRCEHFTEICLDDNKLGNTWGAVVVDASEGNV